MTSSALEDFAGNPLCDVCACERGCLSTQAICTRFGRLSCCVLKVRHAPRPQGAESFVQTAVTAFPIPLLIVCRQVIKKYGLDEAKLLHSLEHSVPTQKKSAVGAEGTVVLKGTIKK